MSSSGLLERRGCVEVKRRVPLALGERVDQNPCVPKTRRRRDARAGVESSQPQMDYSSQVVDLTPAHDYVWYADEGFVGYDRMKDERMFYSRKTR